MIEKLNKWIVYILGITIVFNTIMIFISKGLMISLSYLFTSTLLVSTILLIMSYIKGKLLND